MPINQKCSLVLKDLFLYDFKSAYPRIMSNVDWNFKDVNLNDKEERNISIGIAQRDNENLSSFLIESVDRLIQYYLQENDIDQEDIIVSQRDGFISTKMLHSTSTFLELDFRGFIDLLILTPDRNKYLCVMNNDVIVKGISNQYDSLNSFYRMFADINFYNKKALFTCLNGIKTKFLECNQKEVFMIPVSDDKFIIQTEKKAIYVKNVRYFSISDICKIKYFNHYFLEFCQSLFLEFY